MRRLRPLLLLAVLAASTALPADEVPTAFDFSATRLDGTEFLGSSLAGRTVLLDFWGTWCAPCIHAFPKLSRLHDDFGERLTVVGMAFYSGDREGIAEAAEEHGLEYLILEGHEETIEKFQVLAFPSYVLISPDGEILFSRAGEVSDLYEQISALLPAPS